MITTDGKGGGCGERSSSQIEAPRAGSSASSEAPRYNQKRMGSLSSASRDTQAVGNCSAVNHCRDVRFVINLSSDRHYLMGLNQGKIPSQQSSARWSFTWLTGHTVFLLPN